MDDMVHLPWPRTLAKRRHSNWRRPIRPRRFRKLVRKVTPIPSSHAISHTYLTLSSDYDPHGPVGPTAFWKAADDDEITRFPSSLWFPHHHGLGLVDDSDMESWMEDDVDDEEIADELDDLLAEADMNVEDVVQTYVDHHLDI